MSTEDAVFATLLLPVERKYAAPDGSLIRELRRLEQRGNLAHCILPIGCTSAAVTHQTVEEIWYCFSGLGQIWRKRGSTEEVTDLRTGTCLTIPLGTHFQFRNTGSEPLCILIATMPPWSGSNEAVPVEGFWRTDEARVQGADSNLTPRD